MNAPATPLRDGTRVAVANLIRFLETGTIPEGLFAPDLFTDLSLPHWRLQSATADEIVAIRASEHLHPGQVRVERVEPTEHGFTIEFEERWTHEGQSWYCREMIRADVAGDSIIEMSVYCTGDWDRSRRAQHAREVQLLRP